MDWVTNNGKCQSIAKYIFPFPYIFSRGKNVDFHAFGNYVSNQSILLITYHILRLFKCKFGFFPCKNGSLLRTLDYFLINGEHRLLKDKVLFKCLFLKWISFTHNLRYISSTNISNTPHRHQHANPHSYYCCCYSSCYCTWVHEYCTWVLFLSTWAHLKPKMSICDQLFFPHRTEVHLEKDCYL